MKTTRFIAMATALIMTISVSAQRNQRNDRGPQGRNGHNTEVRSGFNNRNDRQGFNQRNDRGNRQEFHYRNQGGPQRPGAGMHRPQPQPHHHRAAMTPPPAPRHHMAHNLHGYEDRVYYRDNRWHYLRDGHWYAYDRYIEPAYYYSHPLSTFGKAVVGAVALGAIISALAH